MAGRTIHLLQRGRAEDGFAAPDLPKSLSAARLLARLQAETPRTLATTKSDIAGGTSCAVFYQAEPIRSADGLDINMDGIGQWRDNVFVAWPSPPPAFEAAA